MSAQYDALYRQAQTFLSQDPPDFDKALPFLYQAADGGHVEALFQLAGCLIGGHGIDQDIETGTSLLRQAADAGHQYARYNLLQIQESQGVAIEKLLPLYKELAEAGHVHAQVRLMRLNHENGNMKEALKWAFQAVEQKHPQAQYFLAQYYQYSQSPDLEYAHKLYKQSAEQGFTASHWQLGLQYKLGQGVAPDRKKAIEHLRIAADSDFVFAQTALAELLLDSEPEEAIRRFQTASEHGDNDAHAALAEIYLVGKYTDRNPEAARIHAEFAAKHNHPEALRLLGDIYRYGLGVAKSSEEARRYYRKAADLGNLAAHQKLLSESALTDKESYTKAKEYALQQQQAERLYHEAFSAHYGLKRQQNYTEAFELYREAADLGHSKAQTNLGMMYYSGQGVDADHREAVRWLRLAAEQKDNMAQYNLACFYFHGLGVDKNVDEACRWLQEAIDNGHEQPEVLKQLQEQWKGTV